MMEQFMSVFPKRLKFIGPIIGNAPEWVKRACSWALRHRATGWQSVVKESQLTGRYLESELVKSARQRQSMYTDAACRGGPDRIGGDPEASCGSKLVLGNYMCDFQLSQDGTRYVKHPGKMTLETRNMVSKRPALQS
jgi:hypothetical protein